MPELQQSRGVIRDIGSHTLRALEPVSTIEPEDAVTGQMLHPEQTSKLNSLFTAFARALSLSLSAQLQTEVSFLAGGLQERPYARLQTEMSSPGCWAILSLEPSGKPLVVELAPGLAMALVEILLGGASSSVSDPARELTEIEKHLLGDVLELLTQELNAALSRAGSFSVTAQRFETDPSVLEIFQAEDLVSVAEFNAGLNGRQFPLRILQHIDSAQAIAEVPAAVRRRQDIKTPPAPAMPLDLLLAAQVSIDVHLQAARLPLKEMLALRVGDVLHLGRSISSPVEGSVNGVHGFTGHMAKAGRKRAIVVESVGN